MTGYTTSHSTTRTATRGVLYVHSAPSALCPHVEWAVGGVLGVAVNLDWTPQPAQVGTYRAELSWVGAVGSAAAVASALKGWLSAYGYAVFDVGINMLAVHTHDKVIGEFRVG